MGIANQLNMEAWASTANTLLAQISNKAAFLLAIVGGLIAAAFALLIPISALEAFTGASGLSEIIPAARAPLGSSARTLFILFTALLAASIIFVLLLTLRTKSEDNSLDFDDDYVNAKATQRNRMPLSKDDSKLAEQIYLEDKDNFQNFHHNNDLDYDFDVEEKPQSKRGFTALAGTAIASGSTGMMGAASFVKSTINKLPFMGGDDSIKSFDDLPKLRGADKHPDAPARRPLSAHEDLGERILDKENGIDNQLDSNLSRHDEGLQQSNFADDSPSQKSDQGQYESHNMQEDIYLQSQSVEDALPQARDEAEILADGVNSIPVAAPPHNIDQPDEARSFRDRSHENRDEIEVADKESAISDDDALPTIDHLMYRLEALVERRAQRLQGQEKLAVTSVTETELSEIELSGPEPSEIELSEIELSEPKLSGPATGVSRANSASEPQPKLQPKLQPKSQPKSPVKKETQLDDYADVIDHVAIKRAEKFARDNDESQRDEKTVENIEQPEARLVAAVSSTDTLYGENGGDEAGGEEASGEEASGDDIIVTKNQKADMDNALKSALDTLHKMTERSA